MQVRCGDVCGSWVGARGLRGRRWRIPTAAERDTGPAERSQPPKLKRRDLGLVRPSLVLDTHLGGVLAEHRYSGVGPVVNDHLIAVGTAAMLNDLHHCATFEPPPRGDVAHEVDGERCKSAMEVTRSVWRGAQFGSRSLPRRVGNDILWLRVSRGLNTEERSTRTLDPDQNSKSGHLGRAGVEGKGWHEKGAVIAGVSERPHHLSGTSRLTSRNN